jgi:hypothetical protein
MEEQSLLATVISDHMTYYHIQVLRSHFVELAHNRLLRPALDLVVGLDTPEEGNFAACLSGHRRQGVHNHPYLQARLDRLPFLLYSDLEVRLPCSTSSEQSLVPLILMSFSLLLETWETDCPMKLGQET